MNLIFHSPITQKYYRLEGLDNEIKDLFWMEELGKNNEPTGIYDRISLKEVETEFAKLLGSGSLFKVKQALVGEASS